MNIYYQKSLKFQDALKQYAWNIFKTYGRELVLRLEEYNLLQNKHNCIESSTALGFIMEEFLVSKLEMYTHCSDEEFIIDRFVGATTSESYDCFSNKNNMKYMVNVKSEKNGVANNGIAAISQLYRNYCIEDPKIEKNFVIIKVKYSIQGENDGDAFHKSKPRRIHIDDIETYCLEEVDLSHEHKQDNRSWSATTDGKSKRNNGRLQISNSFRDTHKVQSKNISYKNTFNMLTKIVTQNKK